MVFDFVGEAEGTHGKSGGDVGGGGGGPEVLPLPLRVALPNAQMMALLEGVEGFLQAHVRLGAVQQQGAHGSFAVRTVIHNGADGAHTGSHGIGNRTGPARRLEGIPHRLFRTDEQQVHHVDGLALAAGFTPIGKLIHEVAQLRHIVFRHRRLRYRARLKTGQRFRRSDFQIQLGAAMVLDLGVRKMKHAVFQNEQGGHRQRVPHGQKYQALSETVGQCGCGAGAVDDAMAVDALAGAIDAHQPRRGRII